MRLLIPALLGCAAFVAGAAEVEGVKLPDRAQAAGGVPLVLNGARLRKRVFFKVYVMGLYLGAAKRTANEVLALPGPKRIHIHMMRDVGATQFSESLVEGMRENNDENAMQRFAPGIAQMNAVMAELKEAKEGMVIVLDWLPTSGMQMVVNGKPVGKPIPGADFFRGLLRVWLGPNPVQDDLKKALLGQPD
ncbi:MAG: chalcone isomerase family protein [Proteobacteria bacterium]|nr:chalcone isomerase family protein [Pseudomonadota bacterium]